MSRKLLAVAPRHELDSDDFSSAGMLEDIARRARYDLAVERGHQRAARRLGQGACPCAACRGSR